MSHDESADRPGTADQPADAASADTPADDTPDRDADFAPASSDPSNVPYWKRRQQKIREEIDRNRRGDYKVPTWVLVAILAAVIVAWAALIIFS
ncbi:MAG TPA: hypothetical protein VE172_05620 [Stackebrandtia sp.]|uniref:hypothetical protein n=1 Tax=Stackebrandtia sp. TaxID=2023065 RepID=UPI002D4EB8F2|nr:hypothetical protein [Stackebrandtia sp.]HZE38273.1 hypothetical protein [Stackebrandtia sp.]